MNYLLKLSMVLLLGILMTACSTEDSNADENVVAENFGNGSEGACLELVYPLSYEFADGTLVEVESKEELREAKVTYKENNPGGKVRSQLIFPIEVVTAEGETIMLDSKEAFKELKVAECGERTKGSKGDRQKCFELVYPVSYVTEDGTVVSGESRKEVKEAIKAWKLENPTATERPDLQFPIQIINSEGETTDLSTAEELAALKADCKG